MPISRYWFGGGRDLLRATLLFAGVALACAPPARAEFEPGAELPPIALKTTDAQSLDVRLTDGALTVKVDEERSQPKALVIHLLQPDCPQCRAQMRALRPLAARFRERGVLTLGIAHRDTPEAAAEFVKELKPGFPVALGVGSDIAKKFAAGDTLGIADSKGIVRFAQVGFGEGDQKLWEQALEELVSGKPVSKEGVERERLAVGDSVPTVLLPSLRNEKDMGLESKDGKLIFRDENGKETRPKAVLFFYSRY